MIKAPSDNPYSEPTADSGWAEEQPDPVLETDQKLVVGDEGVREVSGADFVEQLNQPPVDPTEEQNPIDPVPLANEGKVGRDFFNRDEEWQATVLGELPDQSTLQVMKKNDNSGNGYYLAYREGLKKVPSDIQGWWTSYDKAELAGRVYLNQQWDQQKDVLSGSTASS